jgi:hypothetical protein
MLWDMSEIRTVTTLRSKRAEILASISLYEKRIAQARADLSHLTAIAIFEASGECEGRGQTGPPFVSAQRTLAKVASTSASDMRNT